MRLKKYITELSMKSDTKIEWSKRGGVETGIIRISQPQTGKFMDEDEVDDIFTFHLHRITRKTSDFGNNYIQSYKNDKVKMISLEFADEENMVIITPKRKGVALKLFAAIEHIFKTKILNSDHDKIIFTGDYEHEKLYNHIAKRLIKSGKYYREAVRDSEVYSFVRKDSLDKIPHHSKIY